MAEVLAQDNDQNKDLDTETGEEDSLQLSASTFAALSEFYREQEDREAREESLLKLADSSDAGVVDSEVKEDWQLSQFWYSADTAQALARMVINVAKEVASKSDSTTVNVACVSSPTLYRHLKKLTADDPQLLPEGLDLSTKVFEYDRRFAAHGSDFVFYDYKSPLSIGRDLRDSFDLVVADPPFLSEECLTKTAVTIKYLAKDRIVLCTGSIMGELADRLLSLKCCKFQPKHANNLANEFSCFSNFDMDSYITDGDSSK